MFLLSAGAVLLVCANVAFVIQLTKAFADGLWPDWTILALVDVPFVSFQNESVLHLVIASLWGVPLPLLLFMLGLSMMLIGARVPTRLRKTASPDEDRQGGRS